MSSLWYSSYRLISESSRELLLTRATFFLTRSFVALWGRKLNSHKESNQP